MNAVQLKAFAWVPLACLLAGQAVASTTVYRSVDEHGTVQFSDTPPADETPVETLEIETPDPVQGEEAAQRLQDMRDTTDRMAADRMAREKHRAEMRRLAAETQYQQLVAEAAQLPVEPYYYGGGYYNPRPPLRPPHLRPPHVRPPIARPPHGRPVNLPSYNNYPASLIRRHYPPQVRDFFNR